ncbi:MULTISPECIES: hypothetical protein [Moorena]|uniref:Uncharacterized protein n=2 Tax=Moorena producens TaxID=1155739 RepID=A0A1D9FZS1_MOOP1|nr:MULTISPECIES: hypothetical protein [Moorena]NEQ13072.1 hypothetical protein [Moorena sp. SIO3E2]NES81907.1 hypothetical protein [Moorena sp. SIO2B7]AOY80867.1 hypothetical protein BJP36_14040 [Moorena producens JHB]EGJ35341.1 hypothetical protein LYNGBM3L_07020 [Moorena producens 3L]NEP33638.1 hypothetical protein [Moorena sp. SIO3B2]
MISQFLSVSLTLPMLLNLGQSLTDTQIVNYGKVNDHTPTWTNFEGKLNSQNPPSLSLASRDEAKDQEQKCEWLDICSELTGASLLVSKTLL